MLYEIFILNKLFWKIVCSKLYLHFMQIVCSFDRERFSVNERGDVGWFQTSFFTKRFCVNHKFRHWLKCQIWTQSYVRQLKLWRDAYRFKKHTKLKPVTHVGELLTKTHVLLRPTKLMNNLVSEDRFLKPVKNDTTSRKTLN